ncbi:MAG: hypothetical protein AAF533_24425 [Acidobacteriota bacterium]
MSRLRFSLALVPLVATLTAPPRVGAGEAGWVSLGGPTGDIAVVALQPLLPGDGVAVERGFAGPFTTDDRGETWRSRRTLASGSSTLLAGDATLLLRVGPSQLERSFDAGATWERLPGGGPDWPDVRDLTVVRDGGPIAVVDLEAAWLSDDLGETWTRLAGTWTEENPARCVAASRSALGELTLLVGVAPYGGVHRWDESTAVWTVASEELEHRGIDEIVISADGVEAGVWARTATVPDVYRSRDGGLTWTQLPGFGPGFAVDLNAHHVEPDHLLLGSYGVVLRSRDGGDTWEPVLTVERASFPVVAFGREDTLIAASRLHGAWWSTDDGLSWRDVSSGLGGGVVQELEVGASNEGEEVVLSAAPDGGPWRLKRQVDREREWEPVSHPETASLAQLGAHPSEPGVFLLGPASSADESALHRTRDGGESWESVPAAGRGGVAALAHDPFEPDTLLLSRNTGLVRSLDGGATWEETLGLDEHHPGRLLADRDQPGRWIMNTRDRVRYEHSLHESVDGGASWSAGPVPLPVMPVPTESFSVEHVAGERLIVFAEPEPGATGPRLWLHDPELGGWVDLDASLSTERPDWWHPLAVAADPDDPRALVLATAGLGVLRSRDGGRSWVSWNVGPDAGTFEVRPGLIRHRPAGPAHPREVLVGTGNGAWSLSVDESDLLLMVSRDGEDVVLEWPEPSLPVTVMRGGDASAPLVAIGPGSWSSSARDPVATDGQLYFYRARH